MARAPKSFVTRPVVQSAAQGVAEIRKLAESCEYSENEFACGLLINRELLIFKLAEYFLEYVDEEYDYFALVASLKSSDLTVGELFSAFGLIAFH